MNLKQLFISACLSLVFIFVNAQERQFSFAYSIESAMCFIDMAEQAVEGKMPTDKEWNELFETEGYRKALENRDDINEWKESIRNAFTLVFDKDKQEVVDHIIALPLEERDDLYYFVYNFHNMKNNIRELHNFIHNTDFDKMFRKGVALAKKYLPKAYRNIEPQYDKFYFVAWDPESRAWDGTFLDINSFYAEGKQGMVRVIGHEMHHHYFAAMLEKMYSKDTQDAAMIAIYRMQNEGTADLINKREMPAKKLGAYDDVIVKLYNEDYLSSPKTLEELDSLTCKYLDGQLTKKQYRQAQQCAHMEGHTTGDWMTFLIRKQLGLQTAIDCLGDFALFVKQYNVAARKAGSFAFSEHFIKHIEEEQEKMK